MRYIIDFTNTASQSDIDSYLSSIQATILKTFASFEKVYLIDSNTTPLQSSIVESVINDEDSPISLLSYPTAPNFEYPEITLSTSLVADWWKVASVNSISFISDTVKYERRGQYADVYIVDSGIQKEHSEFEFADIIELFSFNGDFTDYNGHGTGLASLISGKTCGLTQSRLLSVKIFQNGVNTHQSDILSALDCIVQRVLVHQNRFHVVNMSWAISKNSYIENKIQQLLTLGVAVVCAAGNSGIPIDNVTPASMQDVITVGAYTQDFTPCNFSNYTGNLATTQGQVNYGEIDIWAPGELINIALINGSYSLNAGTSLSSAIQTAALAYNSDGFFYADGTFPSFMYNKMSQLEVFRSRRNLLVLEGVYSSSKNSVTTFEAAYDGMHDNHVYHRTVITLFGYSDQPVYEFVKPFTRVQSFSTVDPLPEGFKLDGPWLIGSATCGENTPFTFRTQMSYYTTENQLVEGELNIIIIPQGTAPSDFENDPVISVVQLNCSDLGGGQCSGSCAPAACYPYYTSIKPLVYYCTCP